MDGQPDANRCDRQDKVKQDVVGDQRCEKMAERKDQDEMHLMDRVNCAGKQVHRRI